MGIDSSAGGFGGRRGFGRAAAVFAISLLAVSLATSGCGGSGHGAETDPEKGSDAAILNQALAQELTLLDLYTRGRALWQAERRPLGRRLRAEQQEYVDDVTKAIRGLGGDTDAEAEKLAAADFADRRAFFTRATELEASALDFYVGEAAQLYTAAPRTLDAWLAAGHGAHLALLPDGGG